MQEFTGPELHRIREMLTQSYGKDVEIQLADCDLLLDGEDAESTACPAVFWHKRGANFVVFKLSMSQFRTQFFYTPHEKFGTGIDEYNDLDECVVAVLQTQSDHERESGGVPTGDNPGASD
jgi:hypothetical protein